MTGQAPSLPSNRSGGGALPERQLSENWIAGVTGPCRQTGTCVASANYPERYGNDEYCQIFVNAGVSASISAVNFNSEKNYDALIVNGYHYSGRYTPGPQDVVPTGIITWSSDDFMEALGWKLCLTSEVQAVRDAEPPVIASGSEMFMYAFMTVMIVWLAPFLVGVPLWFTIFFLLVGCFDKCNCANDLAFRIAHFPYNCYRQVTNSGDPADESDGPMKIVGYCIAWWGLVSLALVLLIILTLGAAACFTTYLVGLLTMLMVLLLLAFMEGVAETGLDNVEEVGASQTASQVAAEQSKSILHNQYFKLFYRFVFLLAVAFLVSLGVFFQFLVDAMLIEAGFELLPSSGSDSQSPSVFVVVQNMKDDFPIMAIIAPIFELFRPLLKWFRGFLDWNFACNPMAWFIYSVVCVSATFIGYLWCTSDVASALYDRQKRLQNGETSESSGQMGFLTQQLCALVVLVILKLNFYTLQLVAQSIISGFPPMIRHESQYCDINVEHPKGIELGYSFAWLLARLVSYYSLYVMLSALFFMVSGLHYDLGAFVQMSKLTKEGFQGNGLREHVKKLNKLVQNTLPIFLQGAFILLPSRFGIQLRADIANRIDSELDTLGSSGSGHLDEVKSYFDQGHLKGAWGFSWQRFKLLGSIVPATFGVHSPGFAGSAYVQRLRCIIWNPAQKQSAQPENVQLATGKVLALAMSAIPAFGVAHAKLLEYNNESSAWLWTEKKVNLLESGIQAQFGALMREGEEYPLHPWVSLWKFQEYVKWTYRLVLSILVVSAAARPSDGTFILVFALILALNIIDVFFQLRNKHLRDKLKLRVGDSSSELH